MKKIAIVAPNYFFPIPSIYGGACEELMTILINQNEINKKADFYLLQKQFSNKQMEELKKFKYNNTKIIYLKSNRFYDFFIKVFNKVFKTLKLKFKLASSYDKKIAKFLNKNKMDKVVFEANFPANASKLNYDRNNIFSHRHTQDNQKGNYFQKIGNIIGVSNFICEDWQKYFQESNINNVKSYMLPNVVNENKFNKRISVQERSNLRKSLGLFDEDFVVIYCGRINEVKGIKPLIEAVVQLDTQIELVIVGSPNFSQKQKSPYLKEVLDLVEKNGNRIKFTGYIQNDNLYKYYQIADLQVVPSIWEEAAGLVVIEGMLSHLPQIITNSGGMPEYVSKSTIIVKKEENLVKSLAEKINEVYSNKELQQKMINDNKQMAENYASSQYIDTFIKIMEKSDE